MIVEPLLLSRFTECQNQRLKLSRGGLFRYEERESSHVAAGNLELRQFFGASRAGGKQLDRHKYRERYEHGSERGAEAAASGVEVNLGEHWSSSSARRVARRPCGSCPSSYRAGRIKNSRKFDPAAGIG